MKKLINHEKKMVVGGRGVCVCKKDGEKIGTFTLLSMLECVGKCCTVLKCDRFEWKDYQSSTPLSRHIPFEERSFTPYYCEVEE